MTVKEIMRRGHRNRLEDLLKVRSAIQKLREKEQLAMRSGKPEEAAAIREKIRKKRHEQEALEVFVNDNQYPDGVETR